MIVLLGVLLAVAQEAAPVEVPAPAGLDLSKSFRLVRVADGKELPVQAAGKSLVWLGGKGEVRVEQAAPAAFPKVGCGDVDGKHLLFKVGGKSAFRYNYGLIKAPDGVDEVFSRSGYVHPIWSPAGKTVTNDFAPKHLHHHGLWFPWTSSEFEGRKSDFWNSKDKQGKIECVKVEETCSGPVFAGFKASHRFINLNGPDGPKAALDEVWEVRLYALSNRFVFDLVSTQTCATDKPIVIKEYRYGGLGFRGSGEWEGKEGVAFLTSEGKTRVDGHATRAKWCTMTGKVGGQDVSVGFLCHPSNFRFPQPMRIHPDEPFFNWAPPQAGDFAIEPGKPYISRYRFVIADGPLPKADMDILWSSYAEPPAPSLK